MIPCQRCFRLLSWNANAHILAGSPSMHPYLHKPLPGYERAPSDVSSIAPSQSASQIGVSPPGSLTEPTWRASSPPPVPPSAKPYTIQIPPAHSISEFALPNGAVSTTIMEETGGSSAEEEDEGPVEVHENPRFSKGAGKAKTKAKQQPKPVPAVPPSRHVSFSLRAGKSSPSDTNIPSSSSLRGESPSKKRGVLGSLAGLFHIGNSRNGAEDSSSGSPSRRWQTRIDRNLSSARRGKDDESSDDEVLQTYAGPSSPRLPTSMSAPGMGGDARLKKRTTKRSSVQTRPATRMVEDTEKGYASDTITESISKSRAKAKRQNSGSKRSTVDGFGGSVRLPNGSPVAGPSGAGRLKKSPAVNAVLVAEGETSLSRNSSLSKQSIASAASAPPRMNPATAAAKAGPSSPPRKRTASLNVEPSTPKAGPSSTAASGHKRTMSTSATSPTRSTLTSGEPSLMTIVEGISRMNKQATLQQDPNRLLVVPKAPGPINIALSESLGELPVIRTSPPRSDSSPGKGDSPTRRPSKKTNGKEPEENNYRNSLLLSASVSAPSLPLNGSTSIVGPDQSKPLPTPVKMPLRSALRNPSRTPSPNPPTKLLAEDTRAGSPSSSSSGTKATPVIQPVPTPVNGPVPATAPVLLDILTAEPPPMKRRESDISSISSYETGREVFDSEPEPDSPAPSSTPVRVPSPPPASASHAPPAIPQWTTHSDGHMQDGSEVSHSTGSTILNGPANGDQPPRRRKSVRMSLPPTFSATPPAIEDTDEDDAGASKHAPWSSPGGGSIAPSSWGTRTDANGARDVWADSSDDDADVEYSKAKRMLAKFSRKHEH